MNKLARLFLLLSLLTTFTAAQTMKPIKESKPGAPGNTKFLAMADQFVKESLALSPVNASQAGYHKHLDTKTGKTIMLDAELDDVGDAGMAAQLAFYRDWRRRFQTETPRELCHAQDARISGSSTITAVNLVELEIFRTRHNRRCTWSCWAPVCFCP
jgi:hypothetical protein